VVGNDLAADRTYANAVLSRINHIPGIADARIEQAFQQPTLNVQVDRSLTSLVGLSEKDAANAILTTLAGSLQTSPTYWLNPKTGVSYPVSVQTPQRDIHAMSGLTNLPVTSGVRRQQWHPVAGWSGEYPADRKQRGFITLQRPPGHRHLCGNARTRSWRCGGRYSPGDERHGKERPTGGSVVLRGQVATMTSAYQQLFVGLALAIVLIYLLIVVNFQSWLDPFVITLALPTAVAGVVWMLFATGTTLSVPALTASAAHQQELSSSPLRARQTRSTPVHNPCNA
jgi:multidrug efflux pump subunit AcrB